MVLLLHYISVHESDFQILKSKGKVIPSARMENPPREKIYSNENLEDGIFFKVL